MEESAIEAESRVLIEVTSSLYFLNDMLSLNLERKSIIEMYALRFPL